jgi:hypothetical protein
MVRHAAVRKLLNIPRDGPRDTAGDKKDCAPASSACGGRSPFATVACRERRIQAAERRPWPRPVSAYRVGSLDARADPRDVDVRDRSGGVGDRPSVLVEIGGAKHASAPSDEHGRAGLRGPGGWPCRSRSVAASRAEPRAGRPPGTGTPQADPDRSGPATAIVVDDTPCLVDMGAGCAPARPGTRPRVRPRGPSPDPRPKGSASAIASTPGPCESRRRWETRRLRRRPSCPGTTPSSRSSPGGHGRRRRRRTRHRPGC